MPDQPTRVPPPPAPAAPPPPTPAPAPRTADEAVALIRRAEQGDEAAVPAVRDLLSRPGLVDLLGGNLADQAARALLGSFAGKNLAVRGAVARQMADLRAELGGPAPSAVERLLAERAVCCWLHLHVLEVNYGSKGSLTLDLAEHYQRCIDRAHKRYLSALKALADVRRLAGPAVQVNIARKQVNVAAGTASVASASS